MADNVLVGLGYGNIFGSTYPGFPNILSKLSNNRLVVAFSSLLMTLNKTADADGMPSPSETLQKNLSTHEAILVVSSSSGSRYISIFQVSS
jgi:hypothetical protein